MPKPNSSPVNIYKIFAYTGYFWNNGCYLFKNLGNKGFCDNDRRGQCSTRVNKITEESKPSVRENIIIIIQMPWQPLLQKKKKEKSLSYQRFWKLSNCINYMRDASVPEQNPCLIGFTAQSFDRRQPGFSQINQR